MVDFLNTIKIDGYYAISIEFHRYNDTDHATIYLRRHGELYKLKKEIVFPEKRYITIMYRLIIRNDFYYDFTENHDILSQGDIREAFELVNQGKNNQFTNN